MSNPAPSINVRDARLLLGDLVKAAPAGHPFDNRALSVADIKQGANGWNAAAIWPIFLAIQHRFPSASSKEELVRNVQTYIENYGIGAALTNIFNDSATTSAVFAVTHHLAQWASLAAVATPPPASEAPAAVTDEDERTQRLAEVLAVQGKALGVAPSNRMSAALQALQSAAAAVAEQETQEAGALESISRRLAVIEEQGASSPALEGEIKALRGVIDAMVETVAALDAKSATVSTAALRSSVAAVITDLTAKGEATVTATTEANARQLPPVAAIDPTFVQPPFHDKLKGWLQAGIHGVIGGNSGAGKTFPLKQALAELGIGFKLISANETLDAETLVALPSIQKGDSTYVDGPLTHSMRHGYPLIVDEGDMVRQGEALVFNEALESGKITIPATGETVTAAEGWCVWFTANSVGDELGNFGHREGFDVSLLQRLRIVVAKPLSLDQEREILLRIVSPSGGRLTAKEAEVLAKWAHLVRPLHFGINGQEAVLRTYPSTRTLVNTAAEWLGFNLRTGKEFPPAKHGAPKGGDIRHALEHTFAADLNEDERDALKSMGLWVW